MKWLNKVLVATVLTVYGIETILRHQMDRPDRWLVATVLTVYGIETLYIYYYISYFEYVATVLTVYGIETRKTGNLWIGKNLSKVATVLTVYGIETLW